mmetsp:Transcript_32285/g.52250  ORF Transcript_32285/g.52250 Transcript_32285/m.52250 type:complete len:237 (-) Transcript_32285:409-1119(-)|eukprot:CAMPEP_0202686836 /NCGR_PEP_ID=MMETSP1385-20130828/2590_1 /ASSEMBLY_ACC=CAM_ASM_000861 /TAXON_ID=933848 /ORGANISM="Elphidium margaritaceum" /LENGTH=236 /DNA_ID=CAMNT_0049341501 /DNA_START=140 /DNA_END=850 /DNA_ORIENTATION=+
MPQKAKTKRTPKQQKKKSPQNADKPKADPSEETVPAKEPEQAEPTQADIEAAAAAAGVDLNSMDAEQLQRLQETANLMAGVGGGAGAGDDDAAHKLNKQEKKARKTIQKLGMKLQKGFTRVTIKKSKNILFVISKPDVYKAPNSDTYIIFGNAKIEDMNQSHREFLSDKWAPKPDAAQMPAIQEDQEEEEDVDATGLDENDIQMVVEQASVSRAKAVKALRNHDGDIVNAIMELTM